MDDSADLLMRTGTVSMCPDCRGERIFVAIDECDADGCEFCCTSCGAAVLIDPICGSGAGAAAALPSVSPRVA